jgi:hypothetical protein
MTRLSRGSRPLFVAVLAGGLAACGLVACGGVSPVSTTTVTAGAAATATAPVTSVPASTAAKPAATAPRSHDTSTSTSTTTAGGSGGGAASFHVQGGDNSIPEYGQEASASERARAETALAAYLRARARGEWPVVCSKLASATRAQLEQLGRAAAKARGTAMGCGQILKALSGTSAAARADMLVSGVAALRVKGTTAFALFHGSRGSKWVITMREEGGAWKVSELAPIPYPFGTTPPALGR